MANSADVNAGDDILASQYNDLREDVLDPVTGHDHEGADGKVLGTGALGDGSVTAEKLATDIGGSNYLKIGNWLICWGRGTIKTTNMAQGNIFISDYHDFTYPIAFIATPTIIVGADHGLFHTWPKNISSNPSFPLTHVYCALCGSRVDAQGYPTYIAIGKWQ